jgi:hypothetical protein
LIVLIVIIFALLALSGVRVLRLVELFLLLAVAGVDFFKLIYVVFP